MADPAISPLELSIVPAFEDDYGDLAYVQAAAFGSADPVGKAIFGSSTDPESLEFSIKVTEQMVQTDPSVKLTKAVVDGRIVGYAQWHFYRDEKTKPMATPPPPPRSRYPDAFHDFVRMMGEARMRHHVGVGYAVLQVLAVLPDYQRQGIGAALVSDGLEDADHLHLPAWLEASRQGYGLYRKMGFAEVDQFTIDLAKYGGEGHLKTVCMLRPTREALHKRR